VTSLVAGATLAPSRASAADETVRDIGLRRELFVDRFLIEQEQIARKSGFHDTRHLSVAFRAEVGLFPVDYRACFRVG
jgi:AraC-like DNA-binding protein